MKTLVIHPKDKTTDFLKPIYHGRGWTVLNSGTKDEVVKAIEEHDHIIMMGHGTPQGLLSVGQFSNTKAAKPSEIVRSSGKPVTSKDIIDYYSGNDKTAPVANSLLDQLPDREPGCDDEDDWFSGRKVSDSFGGYTKYGGYKSYGSGSYKSYGGQSYSSLTTGYVIDDAMVDKLRGKRLTAIWCNADQFMEWNNLSGFYTGMFISDTSEATLIGTANTDQWQVDESNYAFSAAMRGLVDTQNPHEVLKELRRTYSRLAKRNDVAKYNMLRLYARDAVKAEVVAS